jgi:hypothetical protein
MSRIVRLAAGIALGLLVAVFAQATEKKVKQAGLPPSVQSTINAQSAGSTVSAYTKETVEGETLYRASFVADGHARTITVASDGNLVSTEDEITWDSIPAEVQNSFNKVAHKNKLSDFHSVSTDGRIVSYNAMLVSYGNRDRVSVKPNAPALEAIPAAPPVSEKK